MESISVYKTKLFLILLSIAIALGAVSLILVQRIDLMVNNDFYQYSLQFSEVWADRYWSNLYLLMLSLGLSISLAAVSFEVFFAYSKSGRSFLKFLCFSLTIAAASMNVAAAYFFNNLDSIINSDLYSYGLIFNSGWALNYLKFSTLLLVTIWASSILIICSSILLFSASRLLLKVTFARLTSFTLTGVGFLLLGTSILVSSSVLAFVGLGLAFWGIVFSYVRTEKYAKKSLFDSTISSQLTALNHIMNQVQFEGDIHYLPPIYSKEGELQKAFVPEVKGSSILTPEQARAESSMMVNNPSGLLVVAPGAEMIVLFEGKIKSSFDHIKLVDLQKSIAKLFIEELEIARSLNILVVSNTIKVKLENSVFSTPIKSSLNSTAYSIFGSPIVSALACIISKSAAKPVIVEKEQIFQNGKSILVEYRII
jgi:hypothetical protein